MFEIPKLPAQTILRGSSGIDDKLLAHEVLHTVCILSSMMSNELAQHEWVESHPKVADAVERALVAISEIYDIAQKEAGE